MRKLYNKTIEITHTEKQKEKEKKVKILRDLYNTTEHTTMHTMGVPKEERNKDAKAYLKKQVERVFEEIMATISLSMNLQVRNMIRLLKVKNRES